MTMLAIGTARANPGGKSWGQLRVRESKKSVNLPVAVIHGKKAGPHMVFIANQHGNELNGFAAIREFVNRVNPRQMRGTIFAFPTVNPLAARQLTNSWLEEHEGEYPRYDSNLSVYENPYNMNGNWPGKKGGTLAQRVIFELWNKAIMARHRRADFVLDIHSHQISSAVYARNAISADLGLVTGYRQIVITGGEGKCKTLNGACIKHNIMALTLEPEGQEAFNLPAVDETIRALFNLAIFWKMLPGTLALPPEAQIFDPWRSQRLNVHAQRPSCSTLYARHAGLFFTRKHQYDPAIKNELIGEIIDLHTGQVVEQVRAPMGGALYMLRPGRSAVQKGDRLMTMSVVQMVNPRVRLKRKKLDCSYYTRESVIKAPSFAGKP